MAADEIAGKYSKAFEAFRSMLPLMSGKTIAITGTTSGTGYITAKEAVSRGAKVLALNRPSGRAERAIELLEIFCENGGSVQQVDCDLTKFEPVKG